jgi:hypothetical protein
MEEKNVMKCFSKNVHGRTVGDLSRLMQDWDQTPPHFNLLDLKTFLQDKVNKKSQMNDTNKSWKSSEVFFVFISCKRPLNNAYVHTF